MERVAVFPGSFDPITLGHESIVRRAIPLFDRIIVGIGVNSNKQYLFDLEQRKKWIEAVFEADSTVEVRTYQELTVSFCKSINANYLLRGLRNTVDFEFEKSIAQMNRDLDASIETVFMMTDPEHAAINSSIVRDIIRNGGDASQFVPKAVSLA